MIVFGNTLQTKSDQNMHQNTLNCFIFLNILVESWVHTMILLDMYCSFVQIKCLDHSKRSAITLFLYI